MRQLRAAHEEMDEYGEMDAHEGGTDLRSVPRSVADAVRPGDPPICSRSALKVNLIAGSSRASA